MNPKQYKPIRNGQPKRNSKFTKSKGRMLAMAKEVKPITSPQLRESYSNKIEWIRRLIP